MSKQGEHSSQEDLEDIFHRMVNNADDLASTANPQTWYNFLTETIGVYLEGQDRRTYFFERVRDLINVVVPVNVTVSSTTGKTVFRIPRGSPGAGRFMSKQAVDNAINIAKGVD